uniref:Uncharacterized protein n=1 Tax=Eutreptiella gymnastica TaxID=73025 RepID=A0A7S4LFL0_9EUGL
MPHAVPDGSDDNDGDDPFDELHDLGDGDEEEVEDEDIATLEQAIAAVAALRSNSAEPAPDMVVPATDVAVPAANVAVPAADVGVPAADVAVPAADVVVAVPAVDVMSMVLRPQNLQPQLPNARGDHMSCCLKCNVWMLWTRGSANAKFCRTTPLTLRGWISQKEELLQAARDAIKFGRRIKGWQPHSAAGAPKL